MSLNKKSIIVILSLFITGTAFSQIYMMWDQAEPPTVTSYTVVFNSTPIVTWGSVNAIPILTPNRTPPITPGRWKKQIPPEMNYGLSGYRLKACNSTGCSDESNEYIWPTPTAIVLIATVTPSSIPTSSVTAVPIRPTPPKLL